MQFLSFAADKRAIMMGVSHADRLFSNGAGYAVDWIAPAFYCRVQLKALIENDLRDRSWIDNNKC
jgi:hypothetical protein